MSTLEYGIPVTRLRKMVPTGTQGGLFCRRARCCMCDTMAWTMLLVFSPAPDSALCAYPMCGPCVALAAGHIASKSLETPEGVDYVEETVRLGHDHRRERGNAN